MVPSRWLPWLLCRFFLALAGCLILLILSSPFLDDGGETQGRGHRLLAIFARDLAVRRTVIASSLGLAVTALVFFRPGQEPAAASSQPIDSPRPEEADFEK